MATTFYAFRRTVTTSGTPVQLDTFAVEPDQTVLVKAKGTNTGVISIGNSSAEAIKTNDENYLLSAGQSVELKVPNTNEIWIDSTINGDIVEVVVGGGAGSPGTTGGALQSAGADAESNTASAQVVSARLSGFNGTTWDRLRTAITTATSTFTGILNIFGLGKYNASAPTLTDGQAVVDQVDVNGNKKVSLATLIAGEDLTNDRLKVEHQYTSSGVKVADALIKSGAGFVHSITISQADAAPTAGTIQIRDATAAGAGTVLFEWNLTTAVFNPFTIILDVAFSTGLYFDFTTTADVNVVGSYR
jgi:hypothetical protein